jgi:hypothetical protein
MNLIDRVKNILMTPKTEWEVINGETATPPSLLMGYVFPLAIISAAGSLLKGLLFAGAHGFVYYIFMAIIGFLVQAVAFYISVYIIDMLAPSFESEKDLNKSAQLVAYSGTPSYIAALFSFLPFLSILIGLAGWVYCIYVTYLGLGPIKKTPEDKKVVYMVISFIVMAGVYFVLMGILVAVFAAVMGLGAVSGIM